MAKKKTSEKKSSSEAKQKPDKEERFDPGQFFQGIKEELGKVVWPTRKQLISESAAVIFIVGLVGTLIYLFDNLFAWIATQVFR